MYQFVQSDEGATAILQDDKSGEWLTKIFHDNTREATQTIAAYAKKWNEDPIEKMNAIANEAVKVIRENLPAGLKVGELLHDNTLDDNTHKMEGGLSGLMQIIGDAFSTSGNEERDNHLRIF